MQRKGFEGRSALVLRFQEGGVNPLNSHLNMNHSCSRYLRSHRVQLSRCLIPYRPPYRNWSAREDDILFRRHAEVHGQRPRQADLCRGEAQGREGAEYRLILGGDGRSSRDIVKNKVIS